jgi:hypothetical protein
VITLQRLSALFIVAAPAVFANAQNASAPDVPEKIKAPASERMILRAMASGSQIYTCQQSADGKYTWTLKGPEAELRDEKRAVIGKHYAGPTWKLNDGSEVTGKAVARVDSPESDSIPWLLVTATGHAGSGALSRVSSIQRIRTHGGQPPAGEQCGPGKLGAEFKSSYSAEYVFYTAENK